MAQDILEYEAVARRVVEVLSGAFPGSAVQTEKGWQGRVHVRIISPEFNGKKEATRQSLVWDALRASLNADELQRITLILVFGWDDLP